MAITQERFIAVITSGLAWQSAYEALTREIKALVGLVNTDDMTARDALTSITILPKANEPPLAAVANLEYEKRYFATNARRNELARQRASRYRFNNGIAPRATAPDLPQTPLMRKNADKQRLAPERTLEGTLDRATRAEIMAEAAKVLAEQEGKVITDKMLRDANPAVKAANLTPPPDLSDLFK